MVKLLSSPPREFSLNMTERQSKFKAGDYVQRVNQPEVAGIVREPRWDSQVEGWNYLVQFGAQLRALPEEALESVTVVQSPWESFEVGSFSGKTHFVFTLTYERLKNPPARIAHSFATARTQFYPHQFKPLLKFLDNPGKSILIADDVGLGKTIEAAYLLRELDAHQANRTIKNYGQKFTLRLLQELAKRRPVTLMCHCPEDQPHCHRHILEAILEVKV